MSQKMFLAISADKYEFILDFDENIKALAKRWQISTAQIYKTIKTGRIYKRGNCKFEIVELK